MIAETCLEFLAEYGVVAIKALGVIAGFTIAAWLATDEDSGVEID